ncbi:unnamed protein product [Heterobilharzia americana]|nr:unnamed protein product [Heterobilharzia americana]CAH8486195.1 unnamed protein product [Heterobilharzia americana]
MSVYRCVSFFTSALSRAVPRAYCAAVNHFMCSHKVLNRACFTSRSFSVKTEGLRTNGIENAQEPECRSKFIVGYDELCSQIAEGNVQLFDVRNSSDVESTGSIPGSLNIPLVELKKALSLSESEFSEKYGVLKPKTSDPNIVFYGLSDVSAASACELAHNLGFKRAKYYPKGWSEWSVINGKR